jgi:hypothetical protein
MVKKYSMSKFINIKKHIIKTLIKEDNLIVNTNNSKVSSKIFNIVLVIDYKYIPITLNIKHINNKIYIYSIIDNIKNLLYITDVSKIMNMCKLSKTLYIDYIKELIQIDYSWRFLSIPENDKIILFDLNKLFDKKIEYKEININHKNTLHFQSKNKFKVCVKCYSDKIIQIFKNNNNDTVKITILKENNKRTINFIKNPIKYIFFSNNGEYYMSINCNKYINIVNEKIDNSLLLTHEINKESINKWLISDDGCVLVNKLDDKIKVIMLDNSDTLVYTQNIKLNKNDSVLLKYLHFNNNNINNLIIWNRYKQYIKIIGILKHEKEYKISQMINLKYSEYTESNIQSTNGTIYLYKHNDNLIVYDINNILLIPAITEHIKILYKSIQETVKPHTLTEYISFGNITTLKKIKLNNKLKYLLSSLIVDNNIIMDSYDILDIPIIECENLDSIDILCSTLTDINTIPILLNGLENDELFNIKVNLIITLFLNVYTLLRDKQSNIKKYYELCLLYITIYCNNISDVKKPVSYFNQTLR